MSLGMGRAFTTSHPNSSHALACLACNKVCEPGSCTTNAFTQRACAAHRQSRNKMGCMRSSACDRSVQEESHQARARQPRGLKCQSLAPTTASASAVSARRRSCEPQRYKLISGVCVSSPLGTVVNTPLKENTIITGRRRKSKNTNRNTKEEHQTYLGPSNRRQRIQPPGARFTRQHPPKKQPEGNHRQVDRWCWMSPSPSASTLPTHSFVHEGGGPTRRRATQAMITSNRVREYAVSCIYLIPRHL